MTHLPAWLRRRQWAVVGGTGPALAAVIPLALPQAASTPPPPGFGVAATTPRQPSGGHAGLDTTGGGRPGRKGEPGTAEASAAEAQTAKPVRLSIPRLDVTARIVPVGVNGDGTVAVPPNARQAVWYRYGPAPGATAGSAVRVGHVDSGMGDLGGARRPVRRAGWRHPRHRPGRCRSGGPVRGAGQAGRRQGRAAGRGVPQGGTSRAHADHLRHPVRP